MTIGLRQKSDIGTILMIANSRLALYTMTSCLEGIAMTYLKWCFLFSLKLFCKEKNYMNSLIDLEARGVNKYQK